VSFLTKVRGATTVATVVLVAVVARVGLDILSDRTPVAGPGWVLVGFAEFAAALWLVYRLRAPVGDPGDRSVMVA
jgi:hypothetical protein